jgi:hypothetical protein
MGLATELKKVQKALFPACVDQPILKINLVDLLNV